MALLSGLEQAFRETLARNGGGFVFEDVALLGWWWCRCGGKVPHHPMEPIMYIYRVSPIDFWSGWQKPDAVFKVDDGLCGGLVHDAADWRSLWANARDLASRVGWEGDIRNSEGPWITVLPMNDSGGLAPIVIAWKQDNNGTTFVASELRLPWLEEGDNWLEG